VTRAVGIPTTGLYIHIPFCAAKCDYCAFYSVTSWTPEQKAAVVKKIFCDINEIGPYLGAVETVYFGGGTPSTLLPEELRALVEAVRRFAPRVHEVTLEANPRSLTPLLVETATEVGVTRLSLGVQSVSPSVLEAVGRSGFKMELLSTTIAGWKGDISCDLLCDTPSGGLDELRRSVEACARLGAVHLSVYALSIERNTPLLSRLRKQRVDDAHVLDDRLVLETLHRGGFERYEVSNYAIPGHECAHNQGYWNQSGYYGLGPSAVTTIYSADSAVRVTQPTDIAEYVATPFSEAPNEMLSTSDLLLEHVMLGLRTRDGVPLSQVAARYGIDLLELAGTSISRLSGSGHLRVSDGAVVATAHGVQFLDGVLTALFEDIMGNLDTLQT
jgi:oxygen-independent coproporphyrinogen-3 oxidase